MSDDRILRFWKIHAILLEKNVFFCIFLFLYPRMKRLKMACSSVIFSRVSLNTIDFLVSLQSLQLPHLLRDR